MQSPEFKFCLLNDQYFNQATECLTEVFSINEPMGKHLKLPKIELKEFIQGLLIHAFPLNLTWIAIDNSTKKLAAVRVLTDAHNDYEPKIILGEKLQIIFNLLHSLYDNHKQELNPPKNKTLHTWMTAVSQEYQQKGLLRNLYKRGAHWAKKNGYQYCIGEATNIHNLNFLKKETDMSQLNSIEYKKFKHQGSLPFKEMEEHFECALYKYPLKYYPEVENDIPN